MKIVLFVVGLESSGTRWLSRSLHSCTKSKINWDGEYPACVKTPLFEIFHASLPWGSVCNKTNVPFYYPKRCTDFTKNKPARWMLDIPNVLKNDKSRVVFIRRHPRDQLYSKIKNHCHNRSIALNENKIGNELIINSMRKHKKQVFVLHYEYMEDTWQWDMLTKWLNITCSMPKFSIPV